MTSPRKVLGLLFALILSAGAAFTQTFVDDRFTVETVATVSAFTPIGFTFTPDGRMLIWRKRGDIFVVKNGSVLSTPFLDISSRVNRAIDRGLIGFALDPSFATNGYFYVAYVYENAGQNTSDAPRTQRVSRFQVDPANPDRALASSETVLIGTVNSAPCPEPLNGADCIPNDMGAHTINHLAFGNDGKLYVSVGDGATYRDANLNSFRSQDLNHYNGKILRINRDGTAPTDNPFYNGTNSIRSKVYSYGLRNPYRFTVDAATGQVIVGDVGWTHYEEINKGPGKNFGWPCFEGTEREGEFTFRHQRCRDMNISSTSLPEFSYGTEMGATIIMGPVYNAGTYPLEFRGRLFFADYTGKWIKHAAVGPTGEVSDVRDFASNLPEPVYLALGPDGHLYFSAFPEGKIKRIKFNGPAGQPPVAQAAATPTSGQSPLTVQFSSAGSSDPDGGPLTYLWDFGDGSTSVSANPTHQYVSSTVRTFTASLTVFDLNDASASASVNITVGSTPPVPTIESPQSNLTVRSGDVIAFRGSASDLEDGELSESSLNWTVLLRHNTHTHILLQQSGEAGEMVIGEHDAIDTYSYVFTLTATDSSGLSQSTTVELPYQATDLGCPISNVDPSVTICVPLTDGTVDSPVRIVAGTSSTYAIQSLRVMVDGTLRHTVAAGAVDVALPIAEGPHTIVVEATDAGGRTFSSSRSVIVSDPFNFDSTRGSRSIRCSTSTARTVLVCTPTVTTIPAGELWLVAFAKPAGSAPVVAMKIYVDDIERHSQDNNARIDTKIQLAAGTRRVVVQAWDANGDVFNTSRTFSVTATPPPPGPVLGVRVSGPSETPSTGGSVNDPRVQRGTRGSRLSGTTTTEEHLFQEDAAQKEERRAMRLRRYLDTNRFTSR